MALNKITQEEISENSVVGMPEVPEISAEEMQYRVEKVVREVAIKKINEIIEWLSANGATKEELEKTILESGAVLSVFGRAGRIAAQKGDYTAEQVGAASEIHAENHNADGSDPISLIGIGAEPIIRKREIVLSASDWTQKVVPTQEVIIEGATEFDKIDIQPDSIVINQMISEGIVAIYFCNESGVITAYSVGGAPSTDVVLQVTLEEVR